MQRHDFDPIAFTFGVVFTGLGVLFMIGRLEVLGHAQWLWPGLLVLLGLAVLLGARGRGGARTTRPAFESGADPALEDELLHAPMRTIDSESLVDTSSLFTLGPRTRAPEAAATERPQGATAPSPPEEAAPSEPSDATAAATRPEDTAVLPAVDPDADTQLLPESRPKDEGDTDPQGA
ncbi:MAG TPA: hypothetical protein VFA46_10450 [Actinomycetes bacterium]|nr:hypothetical protein [Actinomycetes bacterium]